MTIQTEQGERAQSEAVHIEVLEKNLAVLLVRRGQIVRRKVDDVMVRIVEIDWKRRRILLNNGAWIDPREVEDPLRASYQGDVDRERRAEGRRQAARRGHLAVVFPGVVAARDEPKFPGLISLALILALLQSVAVLAFFLLIHRA